MTQLDNDRDQKTFSQSSDPFIPLTPIWSLYNLPMHAWIKILGEGGGLKIFEDKTDRMEELM